MNKTIFIINGSGGSGKDTVVKFFSDRFQVRNTDSVMPVKNAATILGWDGCKTDENRLFLSELKKLSDRYFNTSYRHVTKEIKCFSDDGIEEVMFIHTREPYNIEKILLFIEANKTVLTNKHNVETYTLLITNTNVDKITTNSSDSQVDNYAYDYLIENNGTLDELKLKVDLLVKETFG